MNGMLAGVRVLDLTRMLAGPYGTMLLADMGAEVIKIEEPLGDFTRYGGHRTADGIGTYFLSINRNKKSVVIDLKKPEGRDVFYELVKVADVVIDNMRPEALKRIGCGYEDLRVHNPGIISCSLSGFGHTGPYRDRPAFDLTVQALSGAMGLTGQPDGPPCKMGLPIGDVAGGMFAAIAILAALQKRHATGKGSRLDVGLLDCLVSMTSYLSTYYFMTGDDPGPQGSRHELIVPYQAFAARDQWLVVACVTPKFWEGLCRVLGCEHLIADERFADASGRLENRDELVAILSQAFATRDRQEWLELLEKEGVPCAPVNTLGQALADPQVKAREMVVEVPHPREGKIRMAGNPVKTGDPDRLEAAPELGGHTAEVLNGLLGYTKEQVERLCSQNIIATPGGKNGN